MEVERFRQEHCVGETLFSAFRVRCVTCITADFVQFDHLVTTVSSSFLYSKGTCFPLCLISDLWDYTSGLNILLPNGLRPVVLAPTDVSCQISYYCDDYKTVSFFVYHSFYIYFSIFL